MHPLFKRFKSRRTGNWSVFFIAATYWFSCVLLPKGREWLLRWLPARAHDNGMFLIFSNGVGLDDDEVRTGNAMILDPYGEILAETWKAADDMVIADLETSLLDMCTGRRWIKTRRPELYGPLTTLTGKEEDTRTVRFARQ